MAAVQWCVGFTFRDAKGQTRRITICYTTSETSGVSAAMVNQVDGLVTTLQTLTNAHVTCESAFQVGGSAQSGVTYGTAADYQSVADQVKLYYLTVDPEGDPSPTAQISIPAPKASIFEADGVTVNPTNTLVAGLNTQLNVGAAVATNVVGCSRNGLPFATFIGGVRVGKKLTRRFTKYTLDPTLSIAGI